jgi:hypothetical protein
MVHFDETVFNTIGNDSLSLSISSFDNENSFVFNPPASIKASSFILLKSSIADLIISELDKDLNSLVISLFF